jgi:hypothetical protein
MASALTFGLDTRESPFVPRREYSRQTLDHQASLTLTAMAAESCSVAARRPDPTGGDHRSHAG